MGENVLITGGAGYIGSHAAHAFLDRDYRVTVLDNLITGFRDAVPAEATFVEGDVGNRKLVGQVIEEYGIDGVVHFAGSVVVPESVADPVKYYRNNLLKSLELFTECADRGVRGIIFSSTAAVYGDVNQSCLREDSPTQPINPYGRSKLATEFVLRDIGSAYGLPVAVLRYFNVAGADHAGRVGQRTAGATHLVKVACECATGARESIEIFGEDYATADGTCVRDFIHVSDLVEAHVLAYEYLRGGGESVVLNCGYGRGYSVREVLDTVQGLSGPLDVRSGSRRPGDPPVIVADGSALRNLLSWQPRYDNIEEIVRSALSWEQHLRSTEGR